MKKFENLNDLLVENLEKIYRLELTLENELINFRQQATSGTLRSMLHDYRQKKEKNLESLEQCLDLLGVAHPADNDDLIPALLQECRASINQCQEKRVVDAALVGSLQKITHFNIASYGTAAAYARTLRKETIASLLHQAVLEEKAMDIQLSEIAEENLNEAAVMTFR